jgi:hypothetical protein
MVRVAAEKEFGSEFPVEFGEELWRWCMQKGVHVYLKRKYYPNPNPNPNPNPEVSHQ